MTKKVELGTVVAERVLEGRSQGQRVTVLVQVGTPFTDPDDASCWYCPYRISKEEQRRTFYGAGVDSVQALRIALANIGAELRTVYKDLELTWMGQSELGFPDRP